MEGLQKAMRRAWRYWRSLLGTTFIGCLSIEWALKEGFDERALRCKCRRMRRTKRKEIYNHQRRLGTCFCLQALREDERLLDILFWLLCCLFHLTGEAILSSFVTWPHKNPRNATRAAARARDNRMSSNSNCRAQLRSMAVSSKYTVCR